MDPSDSSNNSELDSLSDSDWLDVASSKASEDNDSVDGNSDFRPLSRRSFSSHISSTDASAIIAWEGYVDDSGDEESSGHPFTFPAQISPYSPRVVSACSSPDEDPVEDQRVRDALDQSMMSTLSNSRSSSFGRSSIHTTRDLRLSFPDPISSSWKTLNRPFEKEPPVIAAASGDDASHVHEVSHASAQLEDPGSSTIPEVLYDTDTSTSDLSSSSHDLYIVLYGFSTDAKWDLIDQVLDRLSMGARRRTSKSVGSSSTRERELFFDEHETSCRSVAIIDKTESSDIHPNSDLPFDRPSLGVLFLPSSIGSLPDHTRYLPLIPPSSYMSDTPSAQETVRKTAHDRWEKLGIPRKRLLFNHDEPFPILENEALLQIDPKSLMTAFESLLPEILPVSKEHAATPKLVDKLSSPWVLQIFFALTFTLVGCVIGGTMKFWQTPALPIAIPSPTSTSGGCRVSTSINQSVPTILGPTCTEMAVSIPASFKDFALTVFSPPGSLSLVESQSPQSSQSPTSDICGIPVQPECSSHSLDIVRSSKDIIPLTFTRDKALSISPFEVKGKSRETIEDVIYQLSLQVARSVTELLDMEYIQAIARSLGREVREILAVVEELVREIRVQGTMVWEHPFDTVESVRTRLQHKHVQAKRQARRKVKELEEFGGWMIEYATEVLREQKERAKEGAVVMNKRMFKSETWLSHEKAETH